MGRELQKKQGKKKNIVMKALRVKGVQKPKRETTSEKGEKNLINR